MLLHKDEQAELESTKDIWVKDDDSDWVPSLIVSIVPKDGRMWYRIDDWQGYLCATTSIEVVKTLLLAERNAQGTVRKYLHPFEEGIKVIPRKAKASEKKQGKSKPQPISLDDLDINPEDYL